MKKNQRIVSGITATGKLTIGNYFGAIQQFQTLKKDNELFLFIANLHAITTYLQPEQLWNNIKTILCLYLACDLEHENITIFLQSDVSAHSELAYILTCQSTIGEMTRMTQFKDKKTQFRDQNKTNYIPTGLLVYPILMAADILLYDAHLVPVGDDQTQHLELTRNLAVRFNNKFQKNLFTVPEKLTPSIGGRIMDLQNPLQKMSKSALNENGCIYLLDNLDQIAKKIKKAVTDSDNVVKYDVVKKPGVSNLMSIYACLTKLTFKQIENKFRDCHYGQFKNALISELVSLIEKIQKKYQSYCDSPQLNDIIIKGQTRANLVSNKKIKQVKRVMGLARELHPSKT